MAGNKLKVFALNGSLRGRKGVTDELLHSMGSGVQRAGGTWNQITLADYEIESCCACNFCQTSGNWKCIFDGRDDASKIFAQMADADMVVFGCPVYIFGIASPLKRLLERMYSLAPVERMVLTKSGLFFHATDRATAGKPFASVIVCDNMEDLTARNTREYFRIFSKFMDVPHMGCIERRSAALWQAALHGEDARERKKAESVIQAFAKAGENLVIQRYISRSVKKSAEISFVHIPPMVRGARRIPWLRARIAAEVQKRFGTEKI